MKEQYLEAVHDGTRPDGVVVIFLLGIEGCSLYAFEVSASISSRGAKLLPQAAQGRFLAYDDLSHKPVSCVGQLVKWAGRSQEPVTYPNLACRDKNDTSTTYE